MENGDALYARIAELEKENEYHRNRTDALYNVWYEGGNCGDELKDCLLLLYNKDFLQEHFEWVFDDHEFSEDEDSEDEDDLAPPKLPPATSLPNALEQSSKKQAKSKKGKQEESSEDDDSEDGSDDSDDNSSSSDASSSSSVPSSDDDDSSDNEDDDDEIQAVRPEEILIQAPPEREGAQVVESL